MNDNTALARATSANLPTLAKWAQKYNACLIFLNQVRTKMGVMFGDPTTSPVATLRSSTLPSEQVGRWPAERRW
jgi:RecA/RadA recombinase